MRFWSWFFLLVALVCLGVYVFFAGDFASEGGATLRRANDSRPIETLSAYCGIAAFVIQMLIWARTGFGGLFGRSSQG